MTNTIKEVLEFVNENDVKFIRLAFCDLCGVEKNLSIMPGELISAFENGVSIDGSSIKGFRDVTESDLLLFPDPATLTVLPWRPGPGRVVRFYCDIKNPDKSEFSGDSRYMLKKAIKRCESLGYVCKIGVKCDFYLFKTDENGEPTRETLDRGGYLDISPLDKGSNIRREICLCLEEMGLDPVTSHHERGPGQNEIDFKFGDALSCADNFMTFKSVVKAIANRNGLFASFMPKPILEERGSGLNINLSLSQNGFNIFKDTDKKLSKSAEGFISGILEKIPEITLFLNPVINSYDRLGKHGAPKYITWSHQNRSQLIRIPSVTQKERVRMELRSPDPSINPYMAFALIITAGLDGIEKELILPPPLNVDLHKADETTLKGLTSIPSSMEEAIELAQNSILIKNTFCQETMTKYISLKKEELKAFEESKDKNEFYKEMYFRII